MRGKNILWMPLIAMLLSVMMAQVVYSAPPPPLTEISMSPTGRIPGPGLLGHIGDVYHFDFYISNVVDLWAIQFTVNFAPFVAVLSPQDFVEGTFLSEDGTYPTSMAVVTSGLEGTVTFIIMRLPEPGWPPPPRVGVSGNGLLASMNFLVKEAGTSVVEFLDNAILLDSDINEMPYTLGPGAQYYGTTGRLIRVNLPDGRKVKVGQTFPIDAKVKNEGDEPIWVRVVYDIRRVEDARPIELWAGQTYYGGYLGAPPPVTYLYCDGYMPWVEGGWNNPGASLIGPPDENIAWSTSASAITSLYTFEDIDLPWSGYSVVSNFEVEAYTQQDNLDNDFDTYIFTYTSTGDPWLDFDWCNSQGGATAWSWTYSRYYPDYDFPEYYDPDPYADGGCRTEQGINSAEILLHNYGASGVLMEIDSLRLRLEFATIIPVDAPVFGPIMPDEEVELDSVIWISSEDHIGCYELTATLQYSGVEAVPFRHYNSMESPQKTLSFWIVP